MRRFKLEHKRQRKYKAALFMFVVLLTSLIYFNYGKPSQPISSTGFAVDNYYSENTVILDNIIRNEQIASFIEYHPDYSVIFRELDYIELALAKERNPGLYSNLDGRHYEIELFSGKARIIAILDEDVRVIRVYNPSVE